MITPPSNAVRQAANKPRSTVLPQAVQPRGWGKRLLDFLQDPDTMELVLTLAALLLVSTLMLPLGALVQSGDGRFNKSYLQAVHLPAPVLETICADFGKRADPEAAMVCGKFKQGDSVPMAQLPVVLEQTAADIVKAFAEPPRAVIVEIQGLEQALRQGLPAQGSETLNDANEKVAAKKAQIAPYLAAYGLERDSRYGPIPLQCLMGLMAPAWAQATAPVRANLALWLASQLDGRSQTVVLNDATYLSLAGAWQHRNAKGSCAGYGSAEDAAVALAGITGMAHQQAAEAPKSEATRKLLENAWWQWPLWILSGLLLLKIYRRALPNELWQFSGLTLLIWAALGWVSRVWLPFADAANLQWLNSRPGAPLTLPPFPLVSMAAGGVALWFFGAIIHRRALADKNTSEKPLIRQELSSRFAYAGFALCAGIGWLLLLDLSATGHSRNRFLGLYQQGSLWIAIGLLVLATLWRQRVAYWLVRWFAFLASLAGFVTSRRRGKWLGPLLVVMVVGLAFFAMGGYPQVTSEIGRLWLILGMAWYFHVAGDLALQMASKGRLRGFVTFLSPLFIVLAALVLAMGVTDDMGPLLVSAYGGGVFLAAAVTYFLQRRVAAGIVGARFGGLVVLCLWFTGLTEALFMLGSYGGTTASRLESVYLPLASRNDQIGVITWFREATPFFGYGVGHTPWCGHAAADVCRGVPLQIHSDYTFTALWGLFGPAFAGMFAVLSLYWLYLVIHRHGRVTSGAPQVTRHNGTSHIETQGFLSWVCVTWLILTVCQVAVTVAGNLRVLPLTGITYPLVSFGMTSLWVNAIFLGLSMSLDVPVRITSRKT